MCLWKCRRVTKQRRTEEFEAAKPPRLGGDDTQKSQCIPGCNEHALRNLRGLPHDHGAASSAVVIGMVHAHGALFPSPPRCEPFRT